MLRQWHAPSALSLFVETTREGRDCEEDEDIVLWDSGNEPGESPTIGETLGLDEKGQLTELLQEFRDVLQNQPGKTHVAEYRVKTKSENPIRLPPYRLPHAYRDLVKQELKQMEEEGIIERSNSECPEKGRFSTDVYRLSTSERHRRSRRLPDAPSRRPN